jgi:hypothetical protein
LVAVLERRIEVAPDEQGRQPATVIRDVLGDIFRMLTDEGVPVDLLMRIQRDQVPASVRRHLTAVMAPAVESAVGSACGRVDAHATTTGGQLALARRASN